MEPVLPLAERVFSFLKNDFCFGFAQFTPGKASEKADSSPQACLCTKLWGKLAQMPTCPQKNQGPASCSLSWTAASHPGAQCFGRWKCLSQKGKKDLSTESAKPYYYYYLNSEYIENNWQKPRAAQNPGCTALSEVKKEGLLCGLPAAFHFLLFFWKKCFCPQWKNWQGCLPRAAFLVFKS